MTSVTCHGQSRTVTDKRDKSRPAVSSEDRPDAAPPLRFPGIAQKRQGDVGRIWDVFNAERKRHGLNLFDHTKKTHAEKVKRIDRALVEGLHVLIACASIRGMFNDHNKQGGHIHHPRVALNKPDMYATQAMVRGVLEPDERAAVLAEYGEPDRSQMDGHGQSGARTRAPDPWNEAGITKSEDLPPMPQWQVDIIARDKRTGAIPTYPGDELMYDLTPRDDEEGSPVEPDPNY